MDEIKDSIKSWFSDRLKSPYFASVAFVWIMVNRVAIFGIFNFEDNQTVDERVTWVQSQLAHAGFWKFRGFEGTILLAFVFGLLTMLAYEYLKLMGIVVFHSAAKQTSKIKAGLSPSDWLSKREMDKLILEHKAEITSFEDRNNITASLKEELEKKLELEMRNHKKAKENYSKLQIDSKDIETKLNQKVKEQQETVSQLDGQIQEILQKSRELQGAPSSLIKLLRPITEKEFISAYEAISKSYEIAIPLAMVMETKGLIYKDQGKYHATDFGKYMHNLFNKAPVKPSIISEIDL